MDEKLPSEDEIAKLPRWAKIAFAARCAQRVLPLVKYFWPDAPEEHLSAIDRALCLAEKAAVIAAPSATRAAAAAARAAVSAAGAAPSAARAAAYAAAYAADTTRAAYAADADRAADRAAYCAAAADVAALRFIARDFRTLIDAVAVCGWNDNSPVPPKVFGPMWPEGPPPGWPLDPVADVLRLRIEIPDDATDEDVKRAVRELVGTMNDVHRTAGGTGLQVDKLRLFDTSGVPAGVPQ